jgi:hypothetical protein
MRMPDAGTDAGCRMPVASGYVAAQRPETREETLAGRAQLNRPPASGIRHPFQSGIRHQGL